VLEIGCGFGGLLAELSETGLSAVGIDIDDARVGYASAKGFDARVADAQKLPFSTGSFDTVISAAVLEHIPNIRAALREAHRVLTPDGAFVARWGPGWLTYNGPHLIKALGVPWVHLLFSDRTILEALDRQRSVWPSSYLDDKVADFQAMGRLTRRRLRAAAVAEGFEIVEETSHSPHRTKELLSRVPPFDELLAGELTVVLRRQNL
jgi:SAM-dependent methyltransferase